MAASTDTARMLLPEPINGTGDITAYITPVNGTAKPVNGTGDILAEITQFELSSNLQNWMAPRKDADCSPELNVDINQLYPEKKDIRFFHLLDDVTKNDYKSLQNALEKHYLELPEIFRNAFRNRAQGGFEKLTKFLTDLKFLAEKTYPEDSEETREFILMQTFLEELLDQNVRLEIRKQKDICLADALKRDSNSRCREYWFQ